MKDKSVLTRVVRSKDGVISIDPTGKMSGRGAYVCNSTVCLNKAIKSKRLEHAFKCSIPKEIYDGLLQSLASAD